jgi:pyrroloquinoline-quinone synthase
MTALRDGGLLSRDEFLARLRAEGARRYHDKHPVNRRMHEGALSREELRAWVLNRYYYQTRIPIKDALILSKSEDIAFRRAWRTRIAEHDGDREGEGGLERWLRLAEGVGLRRDDVLALSGVLPAVRFACDAYVTFVRERSLLEAVASSLTELFAPELMATRIAAFRRHYPWVDPAALAYFEGRVSKAREEADFALAFVLGRATSREDQERCVLALREKCDILWAVLDALEVARAGQVGAHR